MLIVLALLATVFLAFVSGRRRAHFVAPIGFAIIVALGVLDPSEAASVFSAQAPITIAMTFVLSAALERTGCIDMLGRFASRRAGDSPTLALALLMAAAMLASAVMNNTPVVILMIPLALALARDLGVSPTRLLMPLSFAAIIGGSLTLVGASSNILVSDAAVAHGGAPISMFDMTAPGLIFATVGFAYIFLAAPLLSPDRTPPAPVQKQKRQAGPVERWIKSAVRRLAARVSGRPATHAASQTGSDAGSYSTGQPSAHCDRRHRAAPGDAATAENSGEDSIEPRQSDRPAAPYLYAKAPLALGAIAMVMGGAVLGGFPILYSATFGALFVVATGCVRRRDALKAIDWKLILMIFGMLGLAQGLEKTGGVELFSKALVGFGGQGSPVLLLLALYLTTSILTEFVTNNAVALMMTPLAMALAQEFGGNPQLFVMIVMFASSTSFATPIGYHTNLLVQRAGGYRFHDFLILGLPLNIAFAVIAVLVLPLFFPL